MTAYMDGHRAGHEEGYAEAKDKIREAVEDLFEEKWKKAAVFKNRGRFAQALIEAARAEIVCAIEEA